MQPHSSITLLKMLPHYSQSSCENATPSSSTSPLAMDLLGSTSLGVHSLQPLSGYKVFKAGIQTLFPNWGHWVWLQYKLCDGCCHTVEPFKLVLFTPCTEWDVHVHEHTVSYVYIKYNKNIIILFRVIHRSSK